MNPELFRSLLLEEESATLDFKRDQYPFAGATEEEKSELLKDILGFANGWKRADAYILIGVEDIRGGQSNVVGIDEAEHLDDHSLQQFVKNLVNNPVRFHYEAFAYDGKQVGIIRIEEHQPRPIYLKRDYGKLKKDETYMRRGSSTDPTKPARPEELALMGSSTAAPDAKLEVEFAKVGQAESLGKRIALEAEYCEISDFKEIPDLCDPPSTFDAGGHQIRIPKIGPFYERTNANYYRAFQLHKLSQAVQKSSAFDR